MYCATKTGPLDAAGCELASTGVNLSHRAKPIVKWAASYGPDRCWPLRRRSGQFPPEPYPPLRLRSLWASLVPVAIALRTRAASDSLTPSEVVCRCRRRREIGRLADAVTALERNPYEYTDPDLLLGVAHARLGHAEQARAARDRLKSPRYQSAPWERVWLKEFWEEFEKMPK